MAINKNALIRYKVLDNCFRNTGRSYFIQDLIEECSRVLLDIDPNSKGISRRQILADIAFMESSEGWSIELRRLKNNKKVYFRYEDPSFSINNMPLNELEVNQLRTAVGILSQFKGMPQFEWIQELLPKLTYGISANLQEPAIIDFDNNQYLKGIEHIGILHNAIYYNKVLNISYQPFETELPFEVTIHPYYLKQYNNRWFLFGYNPVTDRLDWNLALDRILAINEANIRYKPNTSINWDDYFEDIIGVTKPLGQAPEVVVLHFEGKTGFYIESKPLHGSQRGQRLTPDTLEVRLEIIINYELKRLILSYGEAVKVISPNTLKNEIRKSLEKALFKYTQI